MLSKVFYTRGSRNHHHIKSTGCIFFFPLGKGFDKRTRYAVPSHGQKPMSCRSLPQFWTLFPCFLDSSEKGCPLPEGPTEIYPRMGANKDMKNKKNHTPFTEWYLILTIHHIWVLPTTILMPMRYLLAEGPEPGQSPPGSHLQSWEGTRSLSVTKQVLNKWQLLLLKSSLKPGVTSFFP